MNKISNKIIFSIILCCLLLAGCIITIGIWQSSKVVKTEALGRLQSLTAEKANQLSITMNNAEKTVDTLSSTIAGIVNPSD